MAPGGQHGISVEQVGQNLDRCARVPAGSCNQAQPRSSILDQRQCSTRVVDEGRCCFFVHTGQGDPGLDAEQAVGMAAQRMGRCAPNGRCLVPLSSS